MWVAVIAISYISTSPELSPAIKKASSNVTPSSPKLGESMIVQTTTQHHPLLHPKGLSSEKPNMSSSTLKPLVLHAHGTGPNPYKIAAALEYLQLPYEVKLWQFGDAPNGVKGPVFLKINENGRVPVLEDPNTGAVSWESGAVMNYLRRVYDQGNRIGPRGGDEQSVVDFEKWEYFLLSTLGPMMGESLEGKGMFRCDFR